MEATARERTWAVVRCLLAAASIVGGFGLIVLAVAFGNCSAFGGTCPAEAPPLWDDDTLRFAAFGAALMVGPAVFLAKPSLTRLWIAIGAAAGAALVVGLIARSISYG